MVELSSQHWSAERYARTASFVPALGTPVLDLLAPRAGERILDLGCGDGTLTARIAAAGRIQCSAAFEKTASNSAANGSS